MGDKGRHDTGIEWTHVPGYKGATWNPVRGCAKISPGCKNCYAETFAERWRGVPGHPYEQGFDLRLVPEKLDEPLRKMKPHAYFVNSMSDLFQEGVPFDFIAATFGVAAASSRHLYMMLTKRHERMAEFMTNIIQFIASAEEPRFARSTTEIDGRVGMHLLPALVASRMARRSVKGFGAYDSATWDTWPLPNVWLGVSVEDRKYGLPRVDVLRTIPAAVRFLSVEPLLEDLGDVNLTGIHWVLVGGESGHGARPFNPAWAYRLLEQCRKQGVPYFMKQMGENAVTDNYIDLPSVQYKHLDDIGDLPQEGFPIRIRTRTRKGGALDDIPEDLRIREWPKCVGEKAEPPCA